MSKWFVLSILFGFGGVALAQEETEKPAEETPAEAAPAEEAPAEDKAAEATPEQKAAEAAMEEPKHEPTADELQSARKHYERGKELFEAEDFDAAMGEFKEAYRLSRNPLLLYNLGFVSDKLGKRDLALFYYERYFWSPAPDPSIRDFINDRIRALKQSSPDSDALADAEMWNAPERAGEGKGGMESADRFLHEVIDTAPPGQPIDVSAFVPPWRNWRVKLFYRPSGQGSKTTRWKSVELRKRYNDVVGRIAEADTKTDAVQYYLEISDRSGTVVERSGSATSPNLIFIEKGAASRFFPDFREEPAYRSAEVKGRRGNSWGDVDSTRFQAAKWGATGGAIVLFAASVGFYAVAADASSSIEKEAFVAGDDLCVGGPPCRSFSERQRGLEKRGRNFESAAHVAVGLGIVGASLAGAMWAWELTHSGHDGDEAPPATAGRAVPVLTNDYVGAAASWGF
jgi:tetratricopeptide (TPR) repeat protein